VAHWIKPDIENRIKNGEIAAYSGTKVVEITQDAVVMETPEDRKTIKNDFVFAMTGYHPEFSFLENMGVRFEGPYKLPVCNRETLESNVPGIFLAGVIVAGARTNEIFIENGRFHRGQIAHALLETLRRVEGILETDGRT
jgi:thioredoxin reductase (NADPH)